VNKFETALSKIGTEAKKAVSIFFGKVLPVAIKGAEEVEPLVDLAFSAIGPEFNIVVAAAAATEASCALIGANTTLTVEQKAAQIAASVEAQLLPSLVGQGLTTAEGQAEILKYSTAALTIMSTFPVSSTAPAVKQAA
jgi:hypothetical protein